MNTLHDQTAPLREAMIEELRALDGIRSEPVAAAFRAVPRHLFAPDTSVELAYAANATLWPKHDGTGAWTASPRSAMSVDCRSREPLSQSDRSGSTRRRGGSPA